MTLPTLSRLCPQFSLNLALLVLLSGCGFNPYTIVFNDNVVYSPNEAVRNGVLQDASLQGCLNQILMASEQQDLAAVTLLACPSAGIQTLAGIEALPNLEQLDVSDNAINNLSPLNSLKNLRVLSLRDNAIGDIAPLDNLPILRFVSLEGNNRIPCRQLDNLQEKLGNTLHRPLSCVN